MFHIHFSPSSVACLFTSAQNLFSLALYIPLFDPTTLVRRSPSDESQFALFPPFTFQLFLFSLISSVLLAFFSPFCHGTTFPKRLGPSHAEGPFFFVLPRPDPHSLRTYHLFLPLSSRSLFPPLWRHGWNPPPITKPLSRDPTVTNFLSQTLRFNSPFSFEPKGPFGQRLFSQINGKISGSCWPPVLNWHDMTTTLFPLFCNNKSISLLPSPLISSALFIEVINIVLITFFTPPTTFFPSFFHLTHAHNFTVRFPPFRLLCPDQLSVRFFLQACSITIPVQSFPLPPSSFLILIP